MAEIRALDFRAFPPCKPDRPVFFPVATKAYAVEILLDRRERFGTDAYLLRFAVSTAFLARFPLQQGARPWQSEYFVMTEDMDAFNAALAGLIEVVREYPAPAQPQTRRT